MSDRPRCPEHDMPDCSPLLNGCTWRPPSSEPTIQLFEGGTKHKVSDMPGWHTHPECLSDSGKPLAHLHGLSKQTPHTHLPVKAWGEAIPLANWPGRKQVEETHHG